MKQAKQKEFQHCVIWQQIDDVGSEYCHLRCKEQDWFLNGTVITTFNNQPTLVEYQICCDEAWYTRLVLVKMQLGRNYQTLKLTRDEQDKWQVNGQDKQSLRQCVDVDLGITPATNTLPIRRLNLSIGETAKIFAAWIRFPQLSVELLPQQYTRLSEKRYKYESSGGAFATEFEVDSGDMVLTYPNLWKRVGTYSNI